MTKYEAILAEQREACAALLAEEIFMGDKK